MILFGRNYWNDYICGDFTKRILYNQKTLLSFRSLLTGRPFYLLRFQELGMIELNQAKL